MDRTKRSHKNREDALPKSTWSKPRVTALKSLLTRGKTPNPSEIFSFGMATS